MSANESISALQSYIDERWAVAQPKFFPANPIGPQVHPLVTPAEARYFLAAVHGIGDEPPLLVVDDERKERSDRHAQLADGSQRGYHFFEAPGRLRLETIVHWAAIARLQQEFGWPREHIICESPAFTEDTRVVLHSDAVDILLLSARSVPPTAKMPVVARSVRAAVEAKADAKKLDKLIAGMRACQWDGVVHSRTDHAKCAAIEVLRPRHFLGVAAGDTWRLFSVIDREGQALLGEEQEVLDELHFAAHFEA